MNFSEHPQYFRIYQLGNYEGPNCQKNLSLDDNITSAAFCRLYKLTWYFL